MIQPPTAERLWNAVLAWEPDTSSRSPSADPDPILDLIVSPKFGPVPLGKLHHREGIYPCALIPTASALHPGGEAYGLTTFTLSNSKDLAISYADGYPSEDNIRLHTIQSVISLHTIQSMIGYCAVSYASDTS